MSELKQNRGRSMRGSLSACEKTRWTAPPHTGSIYSPSFYIQNGVTWKMKAISLPLAPSEPAGMMTGPSWVVRPQGWALWDLKRKGILGLADGIAHHQNSCFCLCVGVAVAVGGRQETRSDALRARTRTVEPSAQRGACSHSPELHLLSGPF